MIVVVIFEYHANCTILLLYIVLHCERIAKKLSLFSSRISPSFNISHFPLPHQIMPSTSPSSLTSLTPSQLKTLKSTILTEHFQFAPESFAKGSFDIANKTLYASTSHAEEELVKVLEFKRSSGEGGGEEDWEKQQEEIQRVSLLHSLSTLDCE